MKGFFHRLAGGFFMFTESVRMSISNIFQNRLRSFLTILGIMIGVTAVIALITTISGVSTSLSDSFSSMGAGTMTVTATGSDLKSGLDADDMDAMAALDHISGVSPSVSVSATVARGDTYEAAVSVAGKNEYYFIANPDLIDRGRAFNPIDIAERSRVCLISDAYEEEFFYGVDPIGKTLYIGGLTFTVVGVLGDEGTSSLTDSTGDVLVPYSTALKMNSATSAGSLTVYVDDAAYTSAVQSELEGFLDALFSYEDDTYEITTMDSIQDTMDTLLSMMSALLAGIASIALVVGGIGIMNMMLTSVTERTVEIGLKKAIGAEPGQIQIQFLIESFLLSVAGGLAGVVLGVALSAILCSVMGARFTLNYGAIALGVGFSAAVGVIFGWSPARKASKLSPIEALRRD